MSIGIGIQLTTRCNLKCTHCFVDGPKGDLTMENLEHIISFAGANKGSFLAFTGGEPTLHPEFPGIMETLEKKGLQFTMVSNGWNFPQSYRHLKSYLHNIKMIGFSLDGATDDIHDLNRSEGSYQRVLQAVSICRSKKIPFGFRTTITRRNIHQLEEMALLAAKVGAEYLAIIPLQPTPLTSSLKVLLHPQDLIAIKEESSRLREIFKMKITLTTGYFEKDPLALCPPLTMKELSVTSRGEVTFCCQIADYAGSTGKPDFIGNLEEESLFEIHKRMIDMVGGYMKEKIELIRTGKLGKLDHIPCWYCLKHFRKVDWLAQFQDNPWSEDLLHTNWLDLNKHYT